jgi:hypothetical protein
MVEPRLVGLARTRAPLPWRPHPGLGQGGDRAVWSTLR